MNLVKRLRNPMYEHAGTAAPRLAAHVVCKDMGEAADEIERLMATVIEQQNHLIRIVAENERLTAITESDARKIAELRAEIELVSK